MPKTSYSLMIHGGAGSVADYTDAQAAVRQILESGQTLLQKGTSALDVVEHCVSLLENSPLFNAGRGAVLNHNGNVELDASIMDGRNLDAGAVAGVVGIKNPVKLARAIMEHSEHVLLIGRGAEQFAHTQKAIEFAEHDYFVTPHRVEQWKAAKSTGKIVLDHTNLKDIEKKFGTVGAVALDQHGNLAAATSTGGIVNKQYGRVGDSPVIGAGTYAENGVCAVSATGYGEQFLRTVISKHTAEIIRYQHIDAQAAAAQGIAYLVEKVQGLGGLIVIDANGQCGRAYSTPGMIYGTLRKGHPPTAHLK